MTHSRATAQIRIAIEDAVTTNNAILRNLFRHNSSPVRGLPSYLAFYVDFIPQVSGRLLECSFQIMLAVSITELGETSVSISRERTAGTPVI